MYCTNTVRLDRAVSTRTSSRPLITLPYLTSKSFRYEQICITARVSSSSIVVFSLLDPVRANLQPHVHRVRHLGVEGVVEVRSEEHTSELQSRENLVCRLLLEQ